MKLCATKFHSFCEEKKMEIIMGIIIWGIDDNNNCQNRSNNIVSNELMITGVKHK